MHSSIMINGEVYVSNRLQPVKGWEIPVQLQLRGVSDVSSCEECTLSQSGRLATLR